MLESGDMFHRAQSPRESLSDATSPVCEACRLLAHISEGDGGVITEVLPSVHRVRCMELGLVPGAHVRVLKTGPAMILSVNGSRFGMSRECLRDIVVAMFRP